MNVKSSTVQVSFRLPALLVRRLRNVSSARSWPPPPSQTEIAARGIELVLATLEKRAEAKRDETR
jgi:hypothetical protein